MADLKKALRDSLHWTMQIMLGFHGRVMEQAMNLFLDAIILVEMLDLFHSTLEVTLEGGPGSLALDALA